MVEMAGQSSTNMHLASLAGMAISDPEQISIYKNIAEAIPTKE